MNGSSTAVNFWWPVEDTDTTGHWANEPTYTITLIGSHDASSPDDELSPWARSARLFSEMVERGRRRAQTLASRFPSRCATYIAQCDAARLARNRPAARRRRRMQRGAK